MAKGLEVAEIPAPYFNPVDVELVLKAFMHQNS